MQHIFNFDLDSIARHFVNTTCVHTRQRDFIDFNRTTDMDETVEAALQISQKHVRLLRFLNNLHSSLHVPVQMIAGVRTVLSFWGRRNFQKTIGHQTGEG